MAFIERWSLNTGQNILRRHLWDITEWPLNTGGSEYRWPLAQVSLYMLIMPTPYFSWTYQYTHAPYSIQDVTCPPASQLQGYRRGGESTRALGPQVLCPLLSVPPPPPNF